MKILLITLLGATFAILITVWITRRIFASPPLSENNKNVINRSKHDASSLAAMPAGTTPSQEKPQNTSSAPHTAADKSSSDMSTDGSSGGDGDSCD